MCVPPPLPVDLHSQCMDIRGLIYTTIPSRVVDHLRWNKHSLYFPRALAISTFDYASALGQAGTCLFLNHHKAKLIYNNMVTMWCGGLLYAKCNPWWHASKHISNAIPHIKTIALILMVWYSYRVQELRIDWLPSCFNMVKALGPPRCCTLSGRCSGNS